MRVLLESLATRENDIPGIHCDGMTSFALIEPFYVMSLEGPEALAYVS